jgi:uncharacterized protein DUF4157/putative peptidoglycan binding protein
MALTARVYASIARQAGDSRSLSGLLRPRIGVAARSLDRDRHAETPRLGHSFSSIRIHDGAHGTYELGAGERLAGERRSLVEARVQTAVGDVRIHRGRDAERAAAALGANAFTIGQDIVLGADAGERVLAHEVAHTVQQSGATAPISGELPRTERQGPEERQAHAASLGMAQPRPGAALALAADEEEEKKKKKKEEEEKRPEEKMVEATDKILGAKDFLQFLLEHAGEEEHLADAAEEFSVAEGFDQAALGPFGMFIGAINLVQGLRKGGAKGTTQALSGGAGIVGGIGTTLGIGSATAVGVGAALGLTVGELGIEEAPFDIPGTAAGIGEWAEHSDFPFEVLPTIAGGSSGYEPGNRMQRGLVGTGLGSIAMAIPAAGFGMYGFGKRIGAIPDDRIARAVIQKYLESLRPRDIELEDKESVPVDYKLTAHEPRPLYIGSTLRRGAQGPAVMTLQQTLADLNPPGFRPQADGAFGPQTRLAVMAFQLMNGLAADGVVGPRTVAAMRERLAAQ